MAERTTKMQGGRFSARLRGFGLVGVFAILVILAGNLIVAPLSALLVLVWARLSNTPWRDLGFVQPKSWTRTLILGALFGIALKFLMKALIMPLLGAPPINQAYHYLAGNTAALPGTILTMIIVAGFGEETVFRGYSFERLGKLFGTKVGARVIIVLLTSVWFALLHYREQGWPGVEQAAVTGLVFGTIFAVTRRLWLPMIAHAAFDLAAVAMIYWNVESDIAHLFFK
ncbi:MAG TPA: CPBP family intramembrane glutamic endopeptidase [Chthoniobacterales bacterium]